MKDSTTYPGFGLSPEAHANRKVAIKKCKYCGGEFVVSQYKRWHGINCKMAFTKAKHENNR